MSEKENALSKRDFSRVILTLDNVLIPWEKLSQTPSVQDGLDPEVEMDLRILGCELIQTSGILLKLPQVAMAAGQVLFQRFYYSKSFVKHDMEVVAMACINLASKIEEAPRRIRDVINVFHHVKQFKNQKVMTPLILDQNYIARKNQVIKAERRILKELGFCCHVKHPHKIIVMYLKVLECDRNRRLVQCAWNYMNDSFRTNLFVRYIPEMIACACIFLAARQLQIPLPNNPPWYKLFQVDEGQIEDICLTILRLYNRPKPNADALEKIVGEVKKLHVEAKLKAKGLSSQNATPNSSSRPATPSKVSPLTLGGANIRRVKDEDNHSDGSLGEKRRKRSHSNSRSGTHSRSRSRSYSSHSHSRSASRSPGLKRKYSPSKKSKKSHKDRYRESHKEKRSLKRARSPSYVDSRSRSISRSPDRPKNKKYHKERYRSRSRSKSYDRYKSEKYRSRSRSHSRENHKSKKRNGHHRSRSHERYRR